ncbi:large ribosomal subunit protein uL30-like [Penaeus indicus]|uniref:large ribosomal subunit protein uL30-like n=1 Tax=Penaeus indicus TaxID=29960 RepID=UPI00300C66A6
MADSAQKAAPAAARPPKRREPKTLPDGTRKPNPYKVEKKRRLPAVPEVVLNRRRERRAHKKKSLALKLKAKADKRKLRQKYFTRAEAYIKKYRTMEKEQLRLKREAKAQGTVLVPAEARLAFVIRVRGVNQIHPKVRKVLKLLRLLQINNGVFVQLNKATLSMLRIAEPFITWGYPNLKTIKQMIYKRGHAKIDGRRVPLYSNTLIEKYLGKYGIICVEDMVHEIFTQGKNFQKVNNFMWNFKLNNPKGGWRMKTKHYVEGGDFGNREGKINALLAKMI